VFLYTTAAYSADMRVAVVQCLATRPLPVSLSWIGDSCEALPEGASTQLFEIEEAREQGRQSSSNEVEALSAEAERLRQRESAARGEVQRLQHELGRLQHRLDEGEGGSGDHDVPGTPRGNEGAASGDLGSLRERLAVRDRVIEQLKAALEEAESGAESEATAATESAMGATAELRDLRQLADDLTVELQARPTKAVVEELSNRIRTLQSLVDAEDGDALEVGVLNSSLCQLNLTV